MIIIIIIRVFIMIVSHKSEQAADPLSCCRCLNQNELAIQLVTMTMIILIMMTILIRMIILIIMIILNQVKTALVNKDLKKAGEMEIKKLDQLLSQVLTIILMIML